MRELERVCEKVSGKVSEMMSKQYYASSLIYRLRLNGVDVDREFGRAVWGVDRLGGLGYGNTEDMGIGNRNHNDHDCGDMAGYGSNG